VSGFFGGGGTARGGTAIYAGGGFFRPPASTPAGGLHPGTLTLHAVADSGVVGFSDGTLNPLVPAGGSIAANTTGGVIGYLYWAFASRGNSTVRLGVYGTPLQSAFAALQFTDQFGVQKRLLTSSAVFTAITGGVEWAFLDPTQAFADGGAYPITLSSS
jgi:hypothetical protein